MTIDGALTSLPRSWPTPKQRSREPLNGLGAGSGRRRHFNTRLIKTWPFLVRQ
jgi:hypothetical protein